MESNSSNQLVRLHPLLWVLHNFNSFWMKQSLIFISSGDIPWSIIQVGEPMAWQIQLSNEGLIGALFYWAINIVISLCLVLFSWGMVYCSYSTPFLYAFPFKYSSHYQSIEEKWKILTSVKKNLDTKGIDHTKVNKPLSSYIIKTKLYRSPQSERFNLISQKVLIYHHSGVIQCWHSSLARSRLFSNSRLGATKITLME